ncbi:MAG: TGS domain-containing protein [archaeon]
MVTNVGYEYVLAEDEYAKATSPADKVAALQRMLKYVPKHKGTEKMQEQIKKRLADMRKEQKKERSAGKKSPAIKKDGAAQIVFIGTQNSGKTEFFNLLSGINDPENIYDIKMRMLKFENIWMQGLDMPTIYSGFAEARRSGQFLSMMRNCDFIVLVINGTDAENQFKLLQSELEKAKVGNIPRMIVYTNQTTRIKTNLEQFFYLDRDRILATVWVKLGKIRVQTRTKDKTAEKPIILYKDATVKELASSIHKDFLYKFKHAKVWGPSAAFPGQQVGFEHKLKDRDVVEIFVK